VRAKTIRLIQENNFEQKRKNVNFEGGKEHGNNNNVNGNFNRGARDYKKNFESNSKGNERKFKKNKFGESDNNGGKKMGNGKKCWECGKEGHFRSECPGKQENKE